jgi:hypothetical protein
MFNIFAKKKYIGNVAAKVYVILYFYPLGLEGLKKEFASNFEQTKILYEKKVPEDQAAVVIASWIMVDILDKLSPEDRENIRKDFERVEPSHFMEVGKALTNGRLETISLKHLPITYLLYNALWKVKYMLNKNQIEQLTYDSFCSEVTGALQGKGEAERRSEFVRMSFDKILHGTI